MEQFPQNQESKFEKIDRKSPEVMKMLVGAPIYRKFGNVQARRATVGEQITTMLADGRQETANKADEGDWIVTNPDGEQHIISEAKFLSRYLLLCSRRQ